MNFIITISAGEDAKDIVLDERFIDTLEFDIDSPDKTQKKSDSTTAQFKIYGRINNDIFEETREIANWSKLPLATTSHNLIYRNVNIKVIETKHVVREYILTTAFVVDYREEYYKGDKDDRFYLFIKQKHDNLADMQIEGNYPHE